MSRAYKTINSKNKKNIRFVAAGSYQIEFFEIEGKEYFTIYRFNYGGEGQAHYHLIDFAKSSIAHVSDSEFDIKQGASTYKLKIEEAKHKVYITRYIWGWLPLSRFGGNVSSSGLATLVSNFKTYAGSAAE